MRGFSHAVISMPLASAKSLRHARSSEPTAGSGDNGNNTAPEWWEGVLGGDSDRRHLCDSERLVKRGSMAAMRSVVASLFVEALTTCARGPVRPRGLDAMRRPSHT